MMYTLGLWAWAVIVARVFLVEYSTRHLWALAIFGFTTLVVYTLWAYGINGVRCRYATWGCRVRILMETLFLIGPAIAPAIALIIRLVHHVMTRVSS